MITQSILDQYLCVDLTSLAPSLVLGVPSQADRSKLGVAFAAASRRLKTSVSVPFTIDQLTTALADLEENLKTPQLRLWYQVPANPLVVKHDLSILIGDETLTVEVAPERLTELSTSGEQREQLGQLALAAAVKRLYSWEWSLAGEFSRLCLRLATREDVRDEALNLLAASLLFQGDSSRAMDALRKAVEGEWNVALQTNLAIVAMEVSPATAVDHMSYLIDGAVNSGQRLQAARIAVALWRKNQGEETGSTNEDDFRPPPRSVLDAIYKLLDESDLTEEDFYAFGTFLARVDSNSLLTRDIFSNSPHRHSPSAALIGARARGLMDFVNEFGPVSRRCEDLQRPWIHTDIEEYVMVIARMLRDDENPATQKLGIVHGFKLFDSGLTTTTVARVLTLTLLIINFNLILDEGGAPKDVMDYWLSNAFNNVSRGTIDMVGDQRERLLSAISVGAITLLQYRHSEILPVARVAEQRSNEIAQHTGGFFSSFTVNRDAVRSVAQPISEFCKTAISRYQGLRPMIQDQDALKGLDEVVVGLLTLSQRVSQWV